MGDDTLNNIEEGLNEYSIPPDHLEAFVEIEVVKNKELSNKFTAKFFLFAVGNLDSETEIISRVLDYNDVETEVVSRALGIVEKETFIDIVYRGNLEALVEIQPIGHNNISTEIEVRPHNRMMAIYEVQQPPILTTIFNPVQDSFTRENKAFETINYGGNSSMVAGNNLDDIWRSFIQFDLDSINSSYVLTESYLRLYYKGSAPSQLNLELYNADEAWLEYSITNLNRPNPIELITNEFTVNAQYGYIEFNVLDIVENWVAKRIINNGFILRVSNETHIGQAIFNTRESMFPPELVVKYYDSRIFSQGRSQFVTEMFVMIKRESDVLVVIEPTSTFEYSDIETEIYCHQVDVPLDSDILVEVLANIPVTESEITASIRGEISELATLDVRIPNDNNVIAEIRVRREEVYIEITPAYRDVSSVNMEITVSVPHIYSEISIYEDIRDSDTLVEIDINEIWISKQDTEIAVSRYKLDVEVTPRVPKKQDVYTVITITRPQTKSEIFVKYRNDKPTEIEPKMLSNVPTSITVSVPYIISEIGVYGYINSEINTEIDIRVFSQVETEIFVKYKDVVESEIDIKLVSQVDLEITVNKPYVHSEIVIPTWVEQDLPTEIQPRILMVSNVYTVIQVGSAGGAYAFII